jgi:hypothetical protein
MTATQSRKAEATVAAIAAKYLDLETLETRNMDSLDFSEQSAAGLKAALLAAYEAGRAAK